MVTDLLTSALPPPVLVGAHLALDFVNSRGRPGGMDHGGVDPGGMDIEWIPDGDSLCDWMTDRNCLPAVALAHLRDAPVAERDDVAARARRLREWFRDFLAQHAGTMLTAGAAAKLAPLNEVLRNDAEYRAVVWDSAAGGMIARSKRWWTEPAQLLQPIAAAMVDLVCHEDFTRVHSCEGPGCTVMFLDTTKNRTRRYCSPAVCGNRAKQAAYRARRRV